VKLFRGLHHDPHGRFSATKPGLIMVSLLPDPGRKHFMKHGVPACRSMPREKYDH